MKTKFTLFTAIISMGLATLFTSVSLRADTTYTDAASFSNAISTPNYYTNFIGLGSMMNISQPLILSGNGYSTAITTGSGTNLTSTGGILFDNSGSSLIFTFTEEENVTAVGGTFLDGTGNTVVVTLNDGTYYSFLSTGFVGFTSPDPITSLTISDTNDITGGIPGANTIQFAEAELVPEPNPGPLFVLGGLGVLVLTVAVRRNRASKR